MKFLKSNSISIKSKNLTLSIFASFLYFGILLFTPKIFTLIQPDSGGYIDFSNIRSSIYPSIIDIFQLFKISLNKLITFQIIVFLISLTSFIYQLLKFKVNKIIICLVYLSLFFNIYYNGFHFTILTESLSFSLILVLIGQLISFFHSKTKMNIIIIISIITLLFSIKPATAPIFVIVLITIIFTLWSEKKIKKISFFKLIFLPILIFLSLENFLFFNNHEEKKTVLERHFFGKAIMIKLFHYQKDKFIDETPNKNTYDFIKKTDNYFNNLSGLYSSCLKLERYGDFENHAYFHLVNEEYFNTLNSRKFIKKTFSNGFNFYIKLTGLHYLNFFCVATPTKFDLYVDTPPLIVKDTFNEHYRKKIIHFLFLGLGIVFFFTNFIYLYHFSRFFIVKENIFDPIDKVNITLIISTQFYLISVAGLSISNPRYLMLVFPLIIFVSLTTLYKLTNIYK